MGFFCVRRYMVVVNNINFRSHHYVFSDDDVMGHRAVRSYSAVVSYFHLFAIAEVCTAVDGRYSSALLEYSLHAEYPDGVTKFPNSGSVRIRQPCGETVVDQKKKCSFHVRKINDSIPYGLRYVQFGYG